MSRIEYYNEDCMVGMARYPDKHFDLAIVDPPYGIEQFKGAQPTRLNRYGSVGIANDIKPDKAFFDELFRVSKNQIIWGYNHLSDLLPPTKEFVFWFKHQPVCSYADGELAWTSFTKTAKCFDYPFFGATGRESDRLHPTQKPVALYKWLLTNYAKQGDKILDTHVGSASSLIACHDMGFDAVGFELDPDYYNASKQRLNDFMSQTRLDDVNNPDWSQLQLL